MWIALQWNAVKAGIDGCRSVTLLVHRNETPWVDGRTTRGHARASTVYRERRTAVAGSAVGHGGMVEKDLWSLET